MRPGAKHLLVGIVLVSLLAGRFNPSFPPADKNPPASRNAVAPGDVAVATPPALTVSVRPGT